MLRGNFTLNGRRVVQRTEYTNSWFTTSGCWFFGGFPLDDLILSHGKTGVLYVKFMIHTIMYVQSLSYYYMCLQTKIQSIYDYAYAVRTFCSCTFRQGRYQESCSDRIQHAEFELQINDIRSLSFTKEGSFSFLDR